VARILVTGVGAIIGYGALKSLRGRGHHLIGMDIYADAYGRRLADEFVQAIRTDDRAYPAFLEATLEASRADLVIPCIEQDVQRFDTLRPLFERRGALCALNTPELIRLATDKWAFHQAEEGFGLKPIPSLVSADFATLADGLGSPFLLKPRTGYAGKGIVKVSCEAEFELFRPRWQEYLAQKIVGSADEEYTVGAFGDGQGGLAAQIQMRRRLSGEGATVKAEVVEDDLLARRVAEYARAFRPLGPTNLQFRRDGEGFALLEINPRISSATSLRAAFGYNEAEMTVGYYLGGHLPEQPPIRKGRAVRYIEDHVEFDDRPDL
jgi:carbamoyl-phosphate synthase large subunit